MRKTRNLKIYHRAWELRQQGNTFKEIGRLMGYMTGAWVRTMVWHTNYKILHQKRLPKELIKLIEKYPLHKFKF